MGVGQKIWFISNVTDKTSFEKTLLSPIANFKFSVIAFLSKKLLRIFSLKFMVILQKLFTKKLLIFL